MKQVCIVLFSVTAFLCLPIMGDEVITFFFKSMPTADKEFRQELSDGLRHPSTINNYLLDSSSSTIGSGIFTTYAGYFSISDMHGQIRFPRQHEKQELYLVISSHMTPIMKIGNTVDHWEFEPGTPAVMYKLEKMYDESSQLYFWNPEKVDLPENNVVPLRSIIVFAKPSHIKKLEPGAYVTRDQPNLVLPDMYVKKKIRLSASMRNIIMALMDVRPFMRRSDVLFQKGDANFSTLIHANPEW